VKQRREFKIAFIISSSIHIIYISATLAHIMCIATQQQHNYNSKKNGVMVAAAAPSGLRPMLPLILYGYAFNTAFYLGVKALLPQTGWDFTVDPTHCPEDNPSCTRTDLAAFQIVALVNLTYLGLLGVYSYYISNKGVKHGIPNTPQGRIFGHLLEADYVNVGIVVFQGWDFVASIFFEEHCTMIMMTHHLLAFICGLYSLEYGVSCWSKSCLLYFLKCECKHIQMNLTEAILHS